jgi:hypothetical protein
MDNLIEIRSRIDSLFESIDSKDTEGFSSVLDENVVFRFGNMEKVNGKEGVVSAVQGFFESIYSLSHRIDDIWTVENVVICHGTVTYTRHDSGLLTVPFANIFKMNGHLIREYLIYADISGLYQ